ncbi:MAG TPA: LamG-like jellyroll fold domain-containing protein [Pyrinomonadaceae bacterium]|nr:LamG-like jellyroll fold domain-containing protein [Pyrinomonadaceae bacterium]
MISSSKIFSSLAVVLLICGSSFGQSAARPDRGATLNRNYLMSDIENINLQNGGVQLSIPLASLPPIAGGKLSWTVSANYNSKIWDMLRMQEEPLGTVFLPYVVDVPSAGGGWTIGGSYSIQFRNARDDFDRIQYDQSSGLPQSEIDLLNNFNWWKVVLLSPDGSERELRPLDYTAYTGSQDFLRGYYNTIPSGSPMRYYTRDGSFMYAKISSVVDWTVYMPDGTRIIQTPDGVQRIQDTNGNKIKIFGDANGGHYQDEQTGREIRLVYDPAANGGQGRYRVFYKTVTGIEHYIDVNMGTTIVQGKTYPVSDFDIVNENICQRSSWLYTELQVVRDIVFPQTEPNQTRKFVFAYNSDTTENTTTGVLWFCGGAYEDYTRTASIGWGELSRVIAPPGAIQTAAYTDYTYLLTSTHSIDFSADDLSRQFLMQKNLNHDGIVETWTFGSGTGGYAVNAPDGSGVTDWAYCGTIGVPGCVQEKAGLSYRTKRPFTMTERHWINLLFSGGDNWGPGGLSPFNPVVDYEYTTLLDANNNPLKMSAKKFQYDYNGNVTQTIEYDWFDPALVSRDTEGVPTGVPASATVLRTTNSSHYNQAVGSTSTNVYAKRPLATPAPLILNAPKETTLGTSIVRLSYDGQAYNVAPTVGNLTKKEVWVDVDSKWIPTSNTYDLYGNVLTATDARGKVTQFFYDDATHALPNRVVVDPQNSTGTQTTTTVYDYSTGVVTSQTDANGQISTIEYTNVLLNAIDPFGRPGIVKAPVINISGNNHRRRVTTTYLDSARQVLTSSDLNTENDKLLKTRTTTDQLGRPILSEQTEDGTNYTISSVQKYLDMGRVILSSSARRGSSSTTDSWTRFTKDNAGRVIEVATFGGATQPARTGTAGVFTGAVTTTYDGIFTTVTDQAGKVRRSMIDALGRLRRVDEPDVNGSLGSTSSPTQPTSYSYDVLGNLTSVTQGTQTRTFTYDSLSRLRTAVNRESGTISYQYDDNGNLVVKTDARTDPSDANKKVSTHFEYDALNRVTRRWYNGSSSINSTTHNSPTLPPGVGATNEAKFYYDSQALPTGAPSYTRGAAIGRLVAQTYGSGSNGDYFAYNVLGQPTLKIQQTGSVNYQLSAAYNLSGAIGTLTYPSGRTVTHTYDQAGRLTTLGGNLGDGITRTYATGILYSPLGALVKEQFGTTTPTYHKLFHNSRGQLFDTRLSSVNDTWDWNRGRLILYYSSNHLWGQTGPDNNGNVRFAETWIPPENATLDQADTVTEQSYTYDSLNRLTSVAEQRMTAAGGWVWSQQFQQSYNYDRWGNRTINPASWGTGINVKQFTVDTANNRLGVPVGQTGTMTYDAAGNLINDTYTGAGNRTYDAENKITSAWGGNNQAQLYGYDASGQRIKRTVNGTETWQVYGFGGELLAEYPASGAATSPQKEYGYRNGELLITASLPGNDHSLNLNGTSAYVQGPSSSSLSIAGAITVEAWIKIDSIGAYRTIISKEAFQQAGTGGGYRLAITDLGKVRLDLFQSHNTYTTAIGTTTVTAGVWQHVAAVFDGSQVRIYLNGVLNGTVATTSGPATGSGNFYLGRFSYPLNPYYFNGLIDEARVSNAVLYTSNFTPANSLTATVGTKGLWKFNGQTTNDSSGNSNNGTLQGGAGYSGSVPGGGGSNLQLLWLVSDHLGTPRMILDQTGSLANMKRHDYLPFGEELIAPIGGRTTAQGYAGGDGVRQQFTLKERDIETGLDYFINRYYASTQGRFSSPDPLVSSRRVTEPQSWNRYNYCANNPLNIIDPNGLDWWYLKGSENPSPVWFDQDPGTDYERWTNTYDYVYYDNAAKKYAVLDPSRNQYFQTNTPERANELFESYFAGSFGVGGQAEGEFLGGLGAGASPFGILINQVHATAGMDTTSRDYMTGQVLGAGLSGGVMLAGTLVFKGGALTPLNKQLATEAQMGDLAAGNGKVIAGAGSSEVLRDAPRLAAQHGGTASDWAKVTSWSYKAADGTKIEVHAYQHIPTGKVVEFKTKIQ